MITFLAALTTLVVIGLLFGDNKKKDVMQSGKVLAKKFFSVGSMSGKRKQDIIAAVGQPNAVSAMSGNKQLLQWQATGYHICIMFDENEIFAGITSEYRGWENK